MIKKVYLSVLRNKQKCKVFDIIIWAYPVMYVLYQFHGGLI